jgi:outer membrane protein assembly factor BamA
VRASAKRPILLCLCLAACRHPQATYPPITAACSDARIGKVIVEGGERDDVPQLAVLEGTLDNPERTERIAAVSSQLLRVRGYSRATVNVSRRTGCGVELVVAVDRGPKFRIRSIEFETDDRFPADVRLAAVEDALGTVNSIGGSYVPDRFTRALEQLQRRYHEQGWLDAEIEPPRAAFDDERGEISVTVPVRAGRRFKIGNVIVRGARRTPRAAVIEALGLRGGQYYDAARVREGIVRARREVDDRLEMRIGIEDGRIEIEAIVGGAP